MTPQRTPLSQIGSHAPPTHSSVSRQHAGGSPHRIVMQMSEPVVELPPELDSILARALQLVPSARYQSARELEQALHGLMRRHQLWMDRASLAEHLRAVCGPDPDGWSRMDERTATAVISGVSLEDGDEDSSAGLDESRADSRGFAVEQTALKQVVFDAAPVITVPWEKLTEGPSVPSTDSSLGEESKPSSSDDTMPLPALLVEPESVARGVVRIGNEPGTGAGYGLGWPRLRRRGRLRIAGFRTWLPSGTCGVGES